MTFVYLIIDVLILSIDSKNWLMLYILPAASILRLLLSGYNNTLGPMYIYIYIYIYCHIFKSLLGCTISIYPKLSIAISLKSLKISNWPSNLVQNNCQKSPQISILTWLPLLVFFFKSYFNLLSMEIIFFVKVVVLYSLSTKKQVSKLYM